MVSLLLHEHKTQHRELSKSLVWRLTNLSQQTVQLGHSAESKGLIDRTLFLPLALLGIGNEMMMVRMTKMTMIQVHPYSNIALEIMANNCNQYKYFTN